MFFGVISNTLPVNAFGDQAVTTQGRTRRIRKTLFTETCFCGSNEQVDPNDTDGNQHAGLIECNARECETRWVSAQILTRSFYALTED